MRYHYLLAVVPVSFVVGLWLGHRLSTEQPVTTPISNTEPEISRPYTLADRKNTTSTDTSQLKSLSARMDAIQSDLGIIRSSIVQLSTSLHAYAESVGNTNSAQNTGTASYTPTPDQVSELQSNIFSRLSDPSFNLNTLNAMPDFQKLSEKDKKPILDEIARRLDSGEINKAAFLPGYNPTLESSSSK